MKRAEFSLPPIEQVRNRAQSRVRIARRQSLLCPDVIGARPQCAHTLGAAHFDSGEGRHTRGPRYFTPGNPWLKQIEDERTLRMSALSTAAGAHTENAET